MTKKCMGCGVLLQNHDKELVGYTPNLDKDYCMRCFRLKNYGELKRMDTVHEEEILTKVNKKNGMVFFLIDYYNIQKYTLAIFKKIKLPKVLVVSKSDLLRKEMKYEKIKKWLYEVYNIEEDILFISNSSKTISNNIFRYMDNHFFKTAYIMGITNAGKSTFINSLLKENHIQKEILTSDKENTTLDFIPIKINDYMIYDTPGFTFKHLDTAKSFKNMIKPITFQLKENTTIVIDNKWKYYFLNPTSVSIYANTLDIKREYKEIKEKVKEFALFKNSDIIIPGIGFMNVKEECSILSNVSEMEIRKNISGVEL